jgi:hypothetical protein
MMIQQQLSPPLLKRLVPFPHPFPNPLPLQQQSSNRMIQIMELHPPSLHPQFVAAKSLIGDLQNLFFTVYCMKTALRVLRIFVK